MTSIRDLVRVDRAKENREALEMGTGRIFDEWKAAQEKRIDDLVFVGMFQWHTDDLRAFLNWGTP